MCSVRFNKDGSDMPSASGSSSGPQSEQQSQHGAHMEYMGTVNPVLPPFVDIEATDLTLPDGVTESDLNDFTAVYREHCEVRDCNAIDVLICVVLIALVL